MRKPMKDWTLGELKEVCANHPMCQECPFDSMINGEQICKVDRAVSDQRIPEWWDLEDVPHE